MSGTDPPTASRTHIDDVLAAELELGTLLFESGAAGQRILDSLDLLNERLGGGEMHVQVSFESILITLGFGTEVRTGVRRYARRSAINGRMLHQASVYVHALPQGADPVAALEGLRALRISTPPAKKWVAIAGYIGFVVVFGFFNHADLGGLAIIAIAGLIGSVTLREVVDRGYGVFVPIMVASLVASGSTLLLDLIIPTDTQLVTMIIPCVFMIPGFQLMNAGWELMRGHEDIGTSRLMFVVNAVLAISAGVLLVLFIYTPPVGGQGIVIEWPWGMLIDMLLAGFAACCIALAYNATRDMMIIAALCAILGRGMRDAVVQYNGDVIIAVFCGCAVISIVGYLLAIRKSLPVGAVLAAASVQFVPGYYYMRTLQGMSEIARAGPTVSPDVISSLLYYAMLSFFISAAIVLGSLLPRVILARSRRWN
jgi:uncharacterized membrane protein YjjB (DUF3815 family)